MPTLWSGRGTSFRVDSSKAMHLTLLELQANMDQLGSVQTMRA
jgi:hypothetical protein